MPSLTITCRDDALMHKILWLLDHFKNDGLEIISKEEMDDLKALQATREEETIDFETYLSHTLYDHRQSGASSS